METTDPTKVVLLAGFSKEEVFTVMRAVKQELGKSTDVAFAMTTARSLEMRLQDVIADITAEHAYFKHKAANPSSQTQA